MGTPFTSFLGPSDLEAYDPKKHYFEQPEHLPKTFIDAIEVREQVFVDEQGCALENEVDADDSRSCHWVVYASINTTTQEEEVDVEGNIVKPKQSITRSTPIGTIRLVPFPHSPHPEPNSTWAPPTTVGPPPYIFDQATTYHDGKEPYIKLGRIAVIKEFRGMGIAKMLASAAISWAQQNPTYFNPSVAVLGLEKLGASSLEEVPVWKGLMCAHAQEKVIKTWEKLGFKVDEGMGKWIEEGITHVGMFQRLNIENHALSA